MRYKGVSQHETQKSPGMVFPLFFCLVDQGGCVPDTGPSWIPELSSGGHLLCRVTETGESEKLIVCVKTLI